MDLPTPPPEPAAAQLPLAEELPSAPAPANLATRTPSSYRVLANLVFWFLAVFLLVRTVALEPFGVPTGSMAPALIGNHREGPCPRCGFPVRVGASSSGGSDHYEHTGCPNCGKRFSLAEARDLNGDRLLVDKNVFNIRQPRRWEMAVFHCPDTDPKEFRKPYVKRIVGLPGETLTIVDGEVYTNGELLRKGRAEVHETRVVVFDMAYAPNPDGWNSRFVTEHDEPHDSVTVRGGELILDSIRTPTSTITYRNWNLDDHKEETIRSWNSYDGMPRSFGQLPPVHDFSFECEVTIEAVAPAGEPSFACRLLDGTDAVQAEVSVGAKSGGRATVGLAGQEPLRAAEGVNLEEGRTYRVEFSFVDRRAILAIDGKEMLAPIDLPPVLSRGEVRRPLQLGVQGCRLVIRNLRLCRDTYYTQFGEHGTEHPAIMGASEYFMLGDNSNNSQDSRKWPRPGVPESEFIGKPFLIHQPLRSAHVSIGGEEREFQTVDWSRLRWLH